MKTEDIKTWQERLCSGDRRLPSQIVQSEIDELRAALKERDAEIARAHTPEPVAWLDPWTQKRCVTDYEAYGARGIPLYAYPPSRQPLTEAEIIKIAQDNLAADPGRDGYILPIKFARAIEAALREKP